MRASKRYAVQIIQCMARSDIYEGRYDFYLGGVLCVWIWSVPRDQEPIYQPDSWRFVRWGTSVIPCSHSKTLNIYWRIGIGKAEKCTNWELKKWMTMKFDSRRFLLVIQRPLVSTDWMVKVENPQSFCHLISYRNRIFVSKSLLLPLPRQSPTQLSSTSWIDGFVFCVWFHSLHGIFQFATFIIDIVTVKGQNSFLTSSFILSKR